MALAGPETDARSGSAQEGARIRGTYIPECSVRGRQHLCEVLCRKLRAAGIHGNIFAYMATFGIGAPFPLVSMAGLPNWKPSPAPRIRRRMRAAALLASLWGSSLVCWCLAGAYFTSCTCGRNMKPIGHVGCPRLTTSGPRSRNPNWLWHNNCVYKLLRPTVMHWPGSLPIQYRSFAKMLAHDGISGHVVRPLPSVGTLRAADSP